MKETGKDHVLEDQNIVPAADVIRARRLESNAAIEKRDVATVVSFYTEDILVISGEGGRHSGRKHMMKIWTQMMNSLEVLFVRNPTDIQVADSGKLAWESGLWQYSNQAPGGRYAAMWIYEGGVWKTKSELFVSLD